MTKKSIFAIALCGLLFASCTLDNTVTDKAISKPDKPAEAAGPSINSIFYNFKSGGYAWGDATFTQNSDGSVTYAGAMWSGYAIWIGGSDYSNLSAFSKLVVEFASKTTVGSQVVLCGEPAINQYGQVGSAFAEAGATKIEMSFAGVTVDDLSQIAIQLADAGEVTIKDIYLVGK